jgi:hypothetical protein
MLDKGVSFTHWQFLPLVKDQTALIGQLGQLVHPSF